ncbi:MAG: hypothetical protein IH594_07040 [Bacteroidales bacterium]|nr:hypothetical protein [Bacteroidales bacterium]
MIRFRVLFFIILFLSNAFPAFSIEFSRNTDTSAIILYEYREAFFNIPFHIDTIYAVSQFNFTQNSGETKCIYFDQGPFQCFFYSESGRSYSIKLPEKYHIDPGWENNPYHQPALVHVPSYNHTEPGKGIDLNHAIRQFDNEFEPFLARLVQSYFSPELAEALLDSFIQMNFTSAKVSDPEYLSTYKKYKKGSLEFHLNQHNLDTLINNYLIGTPVRFDVPSYRTFFSLVLGEYFDYLKRKESFAKVYSEFSKLSASSLRAYLQADPLLLNDTIFETILLRECYHAFYRKDIREEHLIAFIDSLMISTRIAITKETAKELKRQFTWLRNGYNVPEFIVSDINENEVVMNQSHEKLIFLGFCDLDRIQCLRQLEHLKFLQAKYDKYLNSIIILKYSSQKQLEEFMTNVPLSMQIVAWNDYPFLAKRYEVQALPAFYLVGPEGKMLRNPAPDPSGNFEYELFTILRAKGKV